MNCVLSNRRPDKRPIAHEGFHHSEKELREAQRLAQVGSWHWDPQADVVTWSEELYRIAGYDPNLPPPSFQQQKQRYTVESWQRLQHAVQEALQTAAPYELDLEMVRPDGTTRWVRARGEAVRDVAGGVTQLRGTCQDITEKKRAEDTLRDSEEKFRRVFRDAGVGMIIVSPDGHFLAANNAFCECLGYTEEELTQKTAQSITHPEDWPAFSRKLAETLTRGGSYHRFEKRCVHKSGRIVWTESTASLIRTPSGAPLYFVGEVVDVTERKLASEVIANANAMLIQTQEQERARIARDLHDDVNQRLALLAIEIEQISQAASSFPREFRERLGGLFKQVGDIAAEIHAIAHRLHSSKLEYLGIVAAVRSFCQEYALQQKVEIDFSHEDIPLGVPQEVMLCLYRVLQEALCNAVKHSGVRHFEVQLYGGDNAIGVRVSDSGVGFDPEAAMNQRGLGLISMRERLRLVQGAISIESKPNRGTTIRAQVPLGIKGKASGC
jgi:PAS domain S-box-containing protein